MHQVAIITIHKNLGPWVPGPQSLGPLLYLPICSHTVPSLNDVDTSPSIVFNKLNALQCCKSAGPDVWPPAALKETAAEISLPLSIIFSKSLQSGHLPECWKIVNVVPIHKSGSHHLTNNYRPISLTCVVW